MPWCPKKKIYILAAAIIFQVFATMTNVIRNERFRGKCVFHHVILRVELDASTCSIINYVKIMPRGFFFLDFRFENLYGKD